MAKYKSYFALPFFQEGAKKMILITGGNGQLGTELRHLLDEQGIEYVSTDSTELDITDADSTLAKVKEIQPSVIYHCAAYTAVDKAEDEGKELDEKVNVDGTRHVAEPSKANTTPVKKSIERCAYSRFNRCKLTTAARRSFK